MVLFIIVSLLQTQHNITIPPRTVLAEIHAIQQAMGKEPSSDLTTSETKRMEFDLEDSPLPPEWKERITSHTNKVKHHIKLSDNTPFTYPST